ncbi:LuxR C-terminal-related transcriptional regulator [Sciscionella marina]|uniref:LuxR C-terminal-related transcriptional regulator n=1 Tax=Sciscionella marina TaxID=508770 RepID=UPI0003678BF5
MEDFFMVGVRTISSLANRGTELGRGAVPSARSGDVGDFVEETDSLLAVVDSELRVSGGNAAFLRWFGCKETDMLGEPFPELVTTDPAYLRERLGQIGDGRARRLRATITGPSPIGAGRMTIDAVQMPADDGALLLTLVPAEFTGNGRACLVTSLEAKILQGMARGLSSVQMASRLYLSRQGIDYHVARLQRRFKAGNRLELISRAFAAGLLDATTWPPRVPESRLAS